MTSPSPQSRKGDGRHTPSSLADVLERDYFPVPNGAQLHLTEYEWRMVVDALRAAPVSEQGTRDAEAWIHRSGLLAGALGRLLAALKEHPSDDLFPAVDNAKEIMALPLPNER